MNKYKLIEQILKLNFPKDNFTVEGICRFLPKKLDCHGRMYGWDDEDLAVRIFIYILRVKGFKHHLEDTLIK